MAFKPWGHVSSDFNATSLAAGASAFIPWVQFQTNAPDLIGTTAASGDEDTFNNTAGDEQLLCLQQGVIFAYAIARFEDTVGGGLPGDTYEHSVEIVRTNQSAITSAAMYGDSTVSWEGQRASTDGGPLRVLDLNTSLYDSFENSGGAGLAVRVFNGHASASRLIVLAKMTMFVLPSTSIGDPRVYGTAF